jgi:hypothetical protein
MLALTDSQLALLAIAASRIPAHARGRWLQDIAQKLDPRARPLTRQGRYRQRQRNGGAIYDGGWHRSATGDHDDRTSTHGYEPTREAAMAAFASSWRRK